MDLNEQPGHRVGANVKRLRNRRSLTQDELGRLSGVSKMEVYRLEKARTGDPRISTVIKLAKALEIDETELIHGSDDSDGPIAPVGR
jgi:transcriptional regulator with XRE-family HTH domain